MIQATSVEIAGVDVTDARIERMNERLAQRFSRRADREGRGLELQSVTVADGEMDLIYTAEWQG